jgi:L-fucose mutarotase/ribose pyranase (RbsD/FucU family)
MLKNIESAAQCGCALRVARDGAWRRPRPVRCELPADSVARQTVLGRLLRIDGVGAPRAAQAILSVFPLDTFVDDAVLRMEVVGQPDEVPAVQAEVQREIDGIEGKPRPMGSIERFAFYVRPSRRTAS